MYSRRSNKLLDICKLLAPLELLSTVEAVEAVVAGSQAEYDSHVHAVEVAVAETVAVVFEMDFLQYWY